MVIITTMSYEGLRLSAMPMHTMPDTTIARSTMPMPSTLISR